MSTPPDEQTPKFEDIENKTAQDFYNEIDRRVDDFGRTFVSFLPQNEGNKINVQVLIDRVMSLKGSAKYLINQYVFTEEKNKENKENKNDK